MEMLGFMFLQLGFIINLKMSIPKPTQKTEFFGDHCGLDQFVELTTERQNLENKATLLLVFTREWQVNSFIIDSTDRNFHCVKILNSYSIQMRENTYQKDSEYGHLSHSVSL